LVAPTVRGQEIFKSLRARENAAFRLINLDCKADDMAAADRVLRQLITTFEGPEWRSITGENAPETEN